MELSFFVSTKDKNFAEGAEEWDVSLSGRDKEVLVLGKRTVCIRSVFRSVSD